MFPCVFHLFNLLCLGSLVCNLEGCISSVNGVCPMSGFGTVPSEDFLFAEGSHACVPGGRAGSCLSEDQCTSSSVFGVFVGLLWLWAAFLLRGRVEFLFC